MSKKIKRTGCTLMSILLAQGLFPNINAAGGDTNSESKGLNMNELLIVSKYFKNSKDFVNSTMTSKKYRTIIDSLHYNPVEVTPETVKHFTNLQTLHIYDVRNLVDHDGYRKLTLDELEKTIKERYAEVDKRIHKYVIWTNDQSLLSKKEYHNLEFKDNKGYVHYYIDKSKENSDIKIDIRSLYGDSILAGKYGDCPVKELFIEGDVESINMLEICNGGYGLKTIHIAPGIKHIGNLKISGSARKIDIEGENVQIDSTNGNILPRGKDLSIGAVKYEGYNVGSVKKDELFIKEDISDKNKALLFACKNGQLNAVKYLVDHGADVNDRDRYGQTPLENAARSGHLDIVKYLVEEKGANKGDALRYAAYSGHLDIVKYLVEEKGADVANDMNALGDAARSGNLELVKYLVEEKGADVNADNGKALRNAIEKGHLDIVKYLVEHGADVNAKDDFGTTPLENAAGSGNLELVKYLVEEKGADVANDMNALGDAAYSGNLEMVKYLVEKGADVNAKYRDSFGEEQTALMNAARSGNLELVKYLVEEKGADVNADNSWILGDAASSGHWDIVKYLVDHGADVNADNGWTLGNAIEKGHLDIVKYLVEEKGANKGDALRYAAYSGHLDTVKYLVEHGADVNSKDCDGYTPLGNAARSGNLELVKYLKEHGAIENSFSIGFGSNTGFSGSNTGFSGSNTGFSGSNTGFSGSNTGFSGSNTGFSGSNTGFSFNFGF